MISIFALVGLARTVTLPARYYTYSDVSKQLALQGFVVDVSKAPKRTFILSVRNQPIDSFLTALTKAAGDDCTERFGAWSITSNANNELRQTRLADRYIADYTSQLTGTFRQAIDKYRRFQKSADKYVLEEELARNSVTASDAKSTAVAIDMDHGEVSASAVLLTSAVLEENRYWFSGQVFTAPFGTFADELFPTRSPGERTTLGALCEAVGIPPGQPGSMAALGQALEMHLGIGFDPMSGALGMEMLLTSLSSSGILALSSGDIVPQIASPKCLWQSYLSEREESTLALRRRQAAGLLQDQRFPEALTTGAQERPSRQILRWSKSTGAEVIFPVAPLADGPVRTNGLTVANWLKSLAVGGGPISDLPKWVSPGTAAERRSSLTPANSLTVSLASGMYVFSNEMMFVDHFASIPEAELAQIDNLNSVSLTDLIGLASQPFWLGFHGCAPAGALRFGDLIGSVPFLALLSRDPKLAASVKELREGDQAAVPLRNLPLETQTHIFRLFKACTTDIQPVTLQASKRLFAYRSGARPTFGELTASIKRVSETFEFRLTSPPNEVFWFARLEGIGS